MKLIKHTQYQRVKYTDLKNGEMYLSSPEIGGGLYTKGIGISPDIGYGENYVRCCDRPKEVIGYSIVDIKPDAVVKPHSDLYCVDLDGVTHSTLRVDKIEEVTEI